MNKIYILTIILLAYSINTQAQISKRHNYPDGYAIYNYDADFNRTGTWEFYTGSTLTKSINYSKNKVDGDYKVYDTDGNLLCKATFIKNKADGEFVTYYSDQNVKVLGDYVEGKKEGEWVFYYRPNQSDSKFTKVIINYNDDEFKTMTVHNLDGNVVEEISFKRKDNNVYKGTYKSYYDNGDIKSVGNFIKNNNQLAQYVSECAFVDEEGNEEIIDMSQNTNRTYNGFFSFREINECLRDSPKSIYEF